MKRFISILMVSFFLMTLLPTGSVFAEAPSAQNIMWRDATGYGSTMNQNGYNGSTSAVNLVHYNASSTEKTAVVIKTAEKATATLGDYGLTDSNDLIMTMRVKLLGDPISNFSLYMQISSSFGNQWQFKADSNGENYLFVNQSSYGSDAVLKKDTWYNVTTHFSGNYSWTYVFDEATGKQVGYKYTQSGNATTAASARTPYVWAYNTSSEGVLIDDYKYYTVNTDSTFSRTGVSNTEKIALDDSITLTFDQPVGPSNASANRPVAISTSMFSIDNGATISDVILKDFNIVEIKFSGLSNGKTYKLGYSGLTSAAGKTPDDEDKTVTFTTCTKKTSTENFDTTSMGSSEIFQSGTYTAATGYDGSSAIKINSSTSTTHLQTKTLLSNFGLDADSNLIFNIRFKLSGTATENFKCQMDLGTTSFLPGYIKGKADGSYYFLENGGDKTEAPLVTGKWYNLSAKITSAGCYVDIYEADTGSHVIYCGTGHDSGTNRVFIFRLTNIGSTEMAFDDAAMYRIDSTDTVSRIAASIEDGAELASDGILEFTFNQPMDIRMMTSASSSELHKDMILLDGGASVSDVKVKDFNKLILTFKGLEDGFKTYNIDFSNVKSAAGSVFDDASKTFSFKTGADKLHDLTLVGEADLSGVNIGDTLTFTLHSKISVTPTIIAVFYEQSYPLTLEGVEIFTDEAMSVGNNDVELTLKKAHADAKTVKLFAWNGLSGLKPMMSEAEVSFP